MNWRNRASCRSRPESWGGHGRCARPITKVRTIKTLSTGYLAEIRDRIKEIISTGAAQERKTMCEFLVAELRIDGNIATPIINVPLSRDDIPANLQPEVRATALEAVPVRPPIVVDSGVEPRVETRCRSSGTVSRAARNGHYECHNVELRGLEPLT